MIRRLAPEEQRQAATARAPEGIHVEARPVAHREDRLWLHPPDRIGKTACCHLVFVAGTPFGHAGQKHRTVATQQIRVPRETGFELRVAVARHAEVRPVNRRHRHTANLL